MARVIIHDKGDGWPPQIYTDGDVEVISVSDLAPDDRFYRMARVAIPDDLASDIEKGPIGYGGDDPATHAKTVRAVAEIMGESHLKPVE